MATFLLTWLWVAPALFLLFGVPAMDARSKRRADREAAQRKLEWEMIELHATRGREGLEAKLVADLHAVMVQSVMHSTPPGGLSMEFMLRTIRGEIPEDMQDVQLRRPADEYRFYFWPRIKPPRVKRVKR